MRTLTQSDLQAVSGGTFCLLSMFMCKPKVVSCHPKPVCEPKPVCTPRPPCGTPSIPTPDPVPAPTPQIN